MGAKITGMESVQKSFSHFSALSENPRPLLQAVGEMFRDSIEEAFEEQQSPFGARWAPLKLKTIRQKRKQGKSERILRDTGALEDTWSVTAGSDSVTVSGNAKSKDGFPYGVVQQYGNKKTPARPFLPIDEAGDVEPQLLRTVESYLENKIEGLFK